MTFGLAGERGGPAQLLAVASFPDGTPYAARLVVRDRARTSGPYLDVLKVSSTAALPLASRTAPASGARTYMAESRAAADAGLLAKGQQATAFRFPAAAIAALAALDPREAVTVEFLFAGQPHDVIRRAYVEVGDFAAGQAFLASAPR